MSDLVKNLIVNELEGKLLTNDFLPLNKKYYFNKFIRLNSKQRVKTSLPFINDIDTTNIIKKVPNNLDTFNKNYGKFCFGDNPNFHKGVYYCPETNFPTEYLEVQFETQNGYNLKLEEDIFNRFYIFEYDEKTEEMSITRTSLEYLKLFHDEFDISYEIKTKLISEYKEIRKEFKKQKPLLGRDWRSDVIGSLH